MPARGLQARVEEKEDNVGNTGLLDYGHNVTSCLEFLSPWP